MHCFVCDADIPGDAAYRKVRTGANIPVSADQRGSTSSSEGWVPRAVCQHCANQVDFADRRAKLIAGLRALRALRKGAPGVALVCYITYVTWYGGSDPPTPASTAPLLTGTNSVPLQLVPQAVDAGTVQPAASWQHTTADGVCWSLRRTSSGVLLVVDLGGDKVANVGVAPAFEAQEVTAMNVQVDHVRSIIGQSFTNTTASYNLEQDGTLRPVP